MFKPYGIKNRSYLSKNARRDGYKFFQPFQILQIRSHFAEYFDQPIFACNQDHILGTQTQFNNGLATIYFDGSNFVGFTELTNKLLFGKIGVIQFFEYDRITIIIDTLDVNITFPDKFLYINNYNELNMDGYDITIQSRIDGEINLTGSGSDLNLSGQPEGFIVNWSLITINFTGSGSIFSNGVLTT